jgi:hypothetical protein
MKTRVLIVGGGTGGVAAALALASRGVHCVMTECTDWIGGQLTAQAVPPDENRWIEGKEGVQSATRSYLAYREGVRAWYQKHAPLTATARADAYLNPGNGWVSHLCHSPKVGHTVLEQALAPFVASGVLTILLNTEAVSAEVDGDRVRSVTVVRDGTETTIEADYVLDATELGDLLRLTSTAYFAGAEHTSVHGELHGRKDKSDPHDVQAISWCFALEHRPGEDHTIPRPANYDFWRNYVPPLMPPWPGRLFSWTQIGGEEHKPRTFRFVPHPSEPKPEEWEMWRYRRIVDASLFTDPRGYPDVALINMVQMDYFLKPTLEVSPEQREQAFREAREQSLCFVHWMQTEAPRMDGTDAVGFPGLRLRGDELGTADGFAKHPYIREARRLDARVIVTERHVGMQQRRAEGLVPRDAPAQGIGECFADSVGIGHYRLDLHPSTAMRNSIYVEAAPFRIPMGALIPKTTRNLLAAGKCLGVTHITNGCYRLHPVEWNVGESAGHLAAYCVEQGLDPAAVHESLQHTRTLQSQLTRSGIPLSWPWENGAGL